MSERLPSPEQPERKPMTEAQEAKLRDLCSRYQVPFDASHYWVRPSNYFDLPDYATGWIGGDEYEGRTLYVGVDPDGSASS